MNNDQLTIGNDQLPEGYKQTEIRVIPEDWQPYRVGDVVSFSGGSQPPRSTFVFKPKTGYLRLIQIRDYKTDVYETYIPEELAKKKCTEQDVMIGRYGPPIFQILRGIEGAYNVAIIKTIPSEKIDREFLYQFIRNDELFKLMEMLSQRSSGQTGVELPALREYPVALPPLEEQRSIAQALSDVDRLIAALDRAIAKKRAIKTATMQQLLTGKKRLPGFGEGKGYQQTKLGVIPEDWNVKCLGEVGQSLIGLTYRPEDTRDYGTLVLRSSNVQNDRLAYENNVYVDSALPLLSRVIVEERDILICVRNGSKQLIGKCALIDAEAAGSAFGAFMSVFRTKISGFIFYQFQSDVIQTQINEIMGATINQITNKDMAAFQIPLPPSDEEQREIATVLSDMDAEIAALETRLAKTQSIKQGMMQQLLTGKVRLV